MRYLPRVDYDAEFDVTAVRGISPSLEPYAIELHGEQALVWHKLLIKKKHRTWGGDNFKTTVDKFEFPEET